MKAPNKNVVLSGLGGVALTLLGVWAQKAIEDRPEVVLSGTQATVPFEPLDVMKHRLTNPFAPSLLLSTPEEKAAYVKSADDFKAAFDRVLSSGPFLPSSSRMTFWDLKLENRGGVKADNIRLIISDAYAVDHGGTMTFVSGPTSPLSLNSVHEITIASMQPTDAVRIRAWVAESIVGAGGVFVKHDHGIGTLEIEDLTASRGSMPLWPFMAGALSVGLIHAFATVAAALGVKLTRRKRRIKEGPVA